MYADQIEGLKFQHSEKSHQETNSMTQRLASAVYLRGCIEKFPDWPSGARIANGKALCQ